MVGIGRCCRDTVLLLYNSRINMTEPDDQGFISLFVLKVGETEYCRGRLSDKVQYNLGIFQGAE